MTQKIVVERTEAQPQDPKLLVYSVWSWIGESEMVHFVLYSDRQKMEVLLRRDDHPELYDFIIENCGPVDESGAPSYVRRP
jgi:hypothetical protein